MDLSVYKLFHFLISSTCVTAIFLIGNFCPKFENFSYCLDVASIGDDNQDVTESSQVEEVNISMTSITASQISSSQNSDSKNISKSIGTREDHKAY